MLSFKLAFSLSSFTFLKRLFSSSLSVIKVVSAACLRLLIFLLAILIPACESSSPALRMMCSAHNLNKQGDNAAFMYSFPNYEPVHCSTCCFLTCIQASWEIGKLVWYSQLFKYFPVCCDTHTQRL